MVRPSSNAAAGCHDRATGRGGLATAGSCHAAIGRDRRNPHPEGWFSDSPKGWSVTPRVGEFRSRRWSPVAMEIKNLADLYGLPPVDWSAITARLDLGFTQAPDTGGPNRHTCWLTTLDADGAPHTTGLGGEGLDGAGGVGNRRQNPKGPQLPRGPPL